MNMRQMAKYIAEKSQQQMIAAFVIDGQTRIMPFNEKRFDQIMRDYQHQCSGVYYCAPVDWIYDDIVSLAGHSLQ